jgi:hypothetical protein
MEPIAPMKKSKKFSLPTSTFIIKHKYPVMQYLLTLKKAYLNLGILTARFTICLETTDQS